MQSEKGECVMWPPNGAGELWVKCNRKLTHGAFGRGGWRARWKQRKRSVKRLEGVCQQTAVCSRAPCVCTSISTW